MWVDLINNKSKELTSVQDVLDNWGFLYAGLLRLRQPNSARETTTTNDFMATLMRIVTSKHGVILLLLSRNNKPIGFAIGERLPEPRVIQLLAAYVSDKCPERIRVLQWFFEQWCKDNDYVEIRAFTRRINGSAMRWYEEKLGFKREFVGFKKLLCE